ncbi:MAG: 2-amino-4-hydroxy-6-hydroxymethyldihydropteridine diphosphokinase [Anaerolineales bacterium]|nr:2-amino-4-hydroxy-6-hydroxymethyldihydropteridine diphosphokinase [Anaerolineales bacterium]
MQHQVYLALGTNLGEREANLAAARAALPPLVREVTASPIYCTPPWGFEQQPDFLNQVVLAQTEASPLELLAYLKQVEAQVGRKPTFRYGPRVVDLDILFYDDLVLQHPELTIPHPRLAERAFVLVPLADLAPELRHPVSGQTVQAMLAALPVDGIEPYPRVE